MLARARGRDRELLIRVAVGASRPRIARLVFAESLVVAVCGGALGILLARAALVVVNVRALSAVPRLDAASIDPVVLAFAIAATMLSAVAFGLVPAMRAARVDLADGLRAAAVGSASRRGGHFREIIIVTQIALGLVLVVGTGLVIQSFRSLVDAHPGFDPRDTLSMRVATPFRGLNLPEARAAFHIELGDRLRQLPGVTAVGGISLLPLTGQGPLQPYAYNAETARNWEQTSADGYNITPGYFAAIGATLIAGRDFNLDELRNPRRVIIIDDSLAVRAYGSSDKAVGRLLQLEPEGSAESFFEVVGVVATCESPRPAARDAATGLSRRSGANFSLVLRSDASASSLAEPARRIIGELRPGTAVQEVRPLGALVDDALGPLRLAAWLMTGFGILALALASVGIYGVFSYFVGERTREIAVRLALGATPAAVRRLVVARGLKLLALGLGFGLLGAIIVSRLASGLLFAVSAVDLVTYLAATICLTAVALAACWLPARRASRVDPQEGLRQT